MHLRNTGAEPITVLIVENSYRAGTVSKDIKPEHESSVALDLKRNHGWYDFTVRVAGSKAQARFAGHVDTRRSSFSDPLMGGEPRAELSLKG